MKLALLERLLAGRSAGRPLALATDLVSGAQALIGAETVEGDLVLGDETLAAARQAIEQDVTRLIGDVFVETWNPPLRLVIIGAVHIGQALATIAALAGYAVTVIDPRSSFATVERFPDTALIADWPDAVLPGLRPDRRTAIVTLSHDAKIDDPALAAGLRTEAFYLGALGSRRTQAQRVERLTALGFSADEIRRIRGPVGLAIGALTPVEIAVSILAEITVVLRRR